MSLKCRSNDRSRLWGVSTNEQTIVEMPMKWLESADMKESVHEWLEWLEWLSAWMSEWTNEWINQSMNQSVNLRMNAHQWIMVWWHHNKIRKLSTQNRILPQLGKKRQHAGCLVRSSSRGMKAEAKFLMSLRLQKCWLSQVTQVASSHKRLKPRKHRPPLAKFGATIPLKMQWFAQLVTAIATPVADMIARLTMNVGP